LVIFRKKKTAGRLEMLSSEFRLFAEAYRTKVLDTLAQKLGTRAAIKINFPSFSNVQPE
jgi:hypothetical protein